MRTNTIQTDLLDIVYLDQGPADGSPVFLLHGWPDDVRSWQHIAPILNEKGFRTITPYLRGTGETRFLREDTIRDGRAVALAQDVIDLANALNIEQFQVAGNDWGARAAYLLAALFPERVKRIAALGLAFQPNGQFHMPGFEQARRFWYQWFMYIEEGAAAVAEDPVGFARIQWDTWSPADWYNEADFAATAHSFLNPDWAAITLQGYRSRFCTEKTDPLYDILSQRMGAIGQLKVPTLVIVGGEDGCDPAELSENMEHCFTADYKRVVLEGVGHFPQREAPVNVSALLGDWFGGKYP
ncbi:alpha/beta fold hydrolase [Paraflavitalea pollutisoli]|uniref:alpha/beta fold hydrolase n=1 Tax=Paraflavitalea pollutisoli TaxID=3034143 RepID=UPI0023EC98FE|nr:alpha/beta hydrolase [Paraflavitalea sp. H1-2-19X]